MIEIEARVGRKFKLRILHEQAHPFSLSCWSPVLPDDGIKSNPIFKKTFAQKLATVVFYLNREFFKNAQKVA